MFSQIVNPKTNRKVNLNSKKGKEILNNYISIQSGGSVRWNGRRFIAGGGEATRERSIAEIIVLDLLGVRYNGAHGHVQNYSNFWRNPDRRYPQFGYWNNNYFYQASLNEFIRHNDRPSDLIIRRFIDIIQLRFEDSRQHAIEQGETIVFHNHNDIIIGMVRAFWTLTHRRRHARLWLNEIDFLEISDIVAQRNWNEVSVGLTSSIMNYQLPEALEDEAHQTYEQHVEDDLVGSFQGLGI